MSFNEDEEKKYKAEKRLKILEKNFPDLYKQVVDGDLTTYKAIVKAGIASEKIAIDCKNAELAADKIVKSCKPDFVKELISNLIARF